MSGQRDLPPLPQSVLQLIDGVWADTVNPQVQIIPAEPEPPLPAWEVMLVGGLPYRVPARISRPDCVHSRCDPAYPCQADYMARHPGGGNLPAERIDVADTPVLIPSVSEAGYKSPFYIGPMGGPDGGAEDYWNWRKARDSFTATGEPAALEAMTRWVTPDNPPMASDVKPEWETWDSGDYAILEVFLIGVLVMMLMLGAGLGWF